MDFIVGNPPFLGGKKLRTGLGDEYVEKLFELWDGRVPAEADLCCYWFEKARDQIEKDLCDRAGVRGAGGPSQSRLLALNLERAGGARPL